MAHTPHSAPLTTACATYLVKSGALRLLITATSAAGAIAQAIELYGLHGASACRFNPQEST